MEEELIPKVVIESIFTYCKIKKISIKEFVKEVEDYYDLSSVKTQSLTKAQGKVNKK